MRHQWDQLFLLLRTYVYVEDHVHTDYFWLIWYSYLLACWPICWSMNVYNGFNLYTLRVGFDKRKLGFVLHLQWYSINESMTWSTYALPWIFVKLLPFSLYFSIVIGKSLQLWGRLKWTKTDIIQMLIWLCKVQCDKGFWLHCATWSSP